MVSYVSCNRTIPSIIKTTFLNSFVFLHLPCKYIWKYGDRGKKKSPKVEKKKSPKVDRYNLYSIVLYCDLCYKFLTRQEMSKYCYCCTLLIYITYTWTNKLDFHCWETHLLFNHMFKTPVSLCSKLEHICTLDQFHLSWSSFPCTRNTHTYISNDIILGKLKPKQNKTSK